MRRGPALVVATLPMALAAAAPAALDPELARQLAGRVAEAPQDCVEQTFLDGPGVYPGALLYRDGRRVYLNRLNGGCRSLRSGDAVRIEVLSGHLCRGDIVTPFDPFSHIPHPDCVLGKFEPYVRPDRSDAGHS